MITKCSFTMFEIFNSMFDLSLVSFELQLFELLKSWTFFTKFFVGKALQFSRHVKRQLLVKDSPCWPMYIFLTYDILHYTLIQHATLHTTWYSMLHYVMSFDTALLHHMMWNNICYIPMTFDATLHYATANHNIFSYYDYQFVHEKILYHLLHQIKMILARTYCHLETMLIRPRYSPTNCISPVIIQDEISRYVQ